MLEKGDTVCIVNMPSSSQSPRFMGMFCVQLALMHATHLVYQITNHAYWVIKGIYFDVLYDKGCKLRGVLNI